MGFEEFGARGGERRKGNKAPAWAGIFLKKSFYELFFPSAFFLFLTRERRNPYVGGVFMVTLVRFGAFYDD